MSSFLEIVASNALVVMGLALLLVILGRVWKQPASLHVLWVLLLLKLFVPPVYTIGIPAPADQTVSSSKAGPAMARERAIPAEAVSERADGELPWSVTYGEPAVPQAAPARPPSVDHAVVTPPVTKEKSPRGMWAGPSWPVLLICGWTLGTLLLGRACLRRLMGFQRLLRSAEEPSAELREAAQRVGRRLGLRRVPRILVVDLRLSPMVWALGGRARVVFPKSLVEQLGEAGLEAILAHELAHVRRGDHVVRWVELTAIVVFWWHPVVWWARRELRELEEQCCDGMVLDVLPDAGKNYAVSLVETLRFLSETPFVKPLAATGAKPGASLARRIAMLKNYRTTGVRLTFSRALLLLAVAAVPMALALAAEPAKEDKKGEKRLSAVVLPTLEPAATAEIPADNLPGPPLKPLGGEPTAAQIPGHVPPPIAPGPTSVFGSFGPSDAQPMKFDAHGRRVAQTNPPAESRTAVSPPPGMTFPTAPTSSLGRKRAIFRLKNAPAIDVAETIRALYEGEVKGSPYSQAPSVVISSDAVSNCILVSGSEDDIAQIEEFIQTLDAPSSMVRVELLIAEVNASDSEDASAEIRTRLFGSGKSGGIDSAEFAKELAELREQGVLSVLSRPQIMTLDNQPAFVQVGEALVGVPRKGESVPGVTVGLTPRVADETVTMEIDVEIVRAEAGGQAVVATGGESDEHKKLTVQRLITTTAQTTISVVDGRTAILGGLVPDAEAKGGEMIVVLTPHIVTQGPSPAVARSRRSAVQPTGVIGVPSLAPPAAYSPDADWAPVADPKLQPPVHASWGVGPPPSTVLSPGK